MDPGTLASVLRDNSQHFSLVTHHTASFQKDVPSPFLGRDTKGRGPAQIYLTSHTHLLPGGFILSCRPHIFLLAYLPLQYTHCNLKTSLEAYSALIFLPHSNHTTEDLEVSQSIHVL